MTQLYLLINSNYTWKIERIANLQINADRTILGPLSFCPNYSSHGALPSSTAFESYLLPEIRLMLPLFYLSQPQNFRPNSLYSEQLFRGFISVRDWNFSGNHTYCVRGTESYFAYCVRLEVMLFAGPQRISRGTDVQFFCSINHKGALRPPVCSTCV